MTEIVGRAANTVTLAEAACRIGMSESQARNLERAGRFPVPVLREGSWIRVAVAAIDAYLGIPPQPRPLSSPDDDLWKRARIAGLRAELAVLEAEDAPPVSLPEVRRERKRA